MKLTFFEKKVSQKTLIGCAANSGAGGARIQAVPRIVGRVVRVYRLCREQRGGRCAKTGCAASSGTAPALKRVTLQTVKTKTASRINGTRCG